MREHIIQPITLMHRLGLIPHDPKEPAADKRDTIDILYALERRITELETRCAKLEEKVT